MCRRHVDRGTCGTWSTRMWSSSACGAGFPRRWPGVSSGTCCTWRNKPRRGCCFAAVDCCAVVADELQAEFIYEHVEGAKAVAGPGVRSVVIHYDVGVVGGPDKKLHEEPGGQR